MNNFPESIYDVYIDFQTNEVVLDGWFNKEQLQWLVDNFDECAANGFRRSA